MGFAELRSIALFDGITDDQLRDLVGAGEELAVEPGEQLFRAGRPAESWWLLVAGSIELVRHVGAEDTVLGTMTTPGQWAGGFRAWDPNGVYLATGRVVAPTRVLRVPAAELGARAQAWFPFGVHLIKGLLGTVRTIESTARQREALAALGTLAAGLAHEINNPASAATRAVAALRETCDTLMTSLRRLAEAGITADQFVELDSLRRGLSPPTDDGPIAAADREDGLAEWLADHGVAEEWLLAPALAAAGVDPECCDRFLAVVGDRALDPALRWVTSAESTATLLTEVSESTRRVSSLVAAVRSYSQLDRASVQRIQVTEGLDSTLTVLAHKIPPGMTVVRDYAADAPLIEAIPGELNQVWTNLIDNAVDAMQGTGTLRLSTRASADTVVVEVGDTGPGIPPEVRPHVFEPFFTTKDVGSGTGLGLDISRRIVVGRHGGEITVDSGPDGTVFRVTLPRHGSPA